VGLFNHIINIDVLAIYCLSLAILSFSGRFLTLPSRLSSLTIVQVVQMRLVVSFRKGSKAALEVRRRGVLVVQAGFKDR
jgi:hypothetical protein